MEARMKNPAQVLGANQPIQALYKAIYSGGVDPATLELVHLRASQVNGCSACVDSGAKAARKAGETTERLDEVWDAAAARYDENAFAVRRRRRDKRGGRGVAWLATRIALPEDRGLVAGVAVAACTLPGEPALPPSLAST